ncbi:MAG: hypothetical protein RLN88_08015 [Ekhidna sp.]|uniref:hypothetical protein n=1 Tax=Ekhidna sp. TaxID=2608089 RepID=UPI0032EF9948
MKTFTTTLCILSYSWILAQEIDTIRMGQTFENYDDLEMGTMKEVIYTEVNGATRFGAMKIKSVKEVEIDGKKYLEFKHTWMSGNTDFNGDFYYLCEPQTLKPVLHIRNTKQKGKEGFRFTDTAIIPLDTVQDNVVKDLDIQLEVPTYAWEIDLETYSLLPMKKGYQAVMNFYHPGGPAPAYYTLKVEGDEKLVLPSGETMDCWVLFTDYGGTQPSRFWYTKRGQNFVKMEGNYGQVKIRKKRLY